MREQLKKTSLTCINFRYAMKAKKVKEAFAGEKLGWHRDSNLRLSDPLFFIIAPSGQYSGGPSSRCNSHCFSHYQSNAEPLHPVEYLSIWLTGKLPQWSPTNLQLSFFLYQTLLDFRLRMGFELPSSVGIILLALTIKLLFCLLYWLLVLRRNKTRRLQSDAEDQQEVEQQQQQQHRHWQQQRHLAANPPPAYQDVVTTNKYPIFVISLEDLEQDPENEPPAYEFAVRRSTTDAVHN